MLSHIQLFAALWTVSRQAPLSLGLFRQEQEWVAIPFSRGCSRPRHWTFISYVSCITGGCFNTELSGKSAIVINDHIFSGLEHHKFMLLHLWCLEFLMGGRAVLLLKALGEYPFPWLFQLLKAPAFFGLWPCCMLFLPSHVQLWLCTSCFPLRGPLAPSYWIAQDFKILNLIISTKSLFST